MQALSLSFWLIRREHSQARSAEGSVIVEPPTAIDPADAGIDMSRKPFDRRVAVAP